MYAPIADYALIGDNHTAVLISSHGSIDWACFPHFDSPAVFLRLLDDERGGHCGIEADGLQFTARRYLTRSNILETTFHTATGVFTVTDFMPIHPRDEKGRHGQDVDTEHRIVRRFRCVSGEVSFRVAIFPTFDYARAEARVVYRARGAIVFEAGNHALHAHHTGEHNEHDRGVAIRFVLRAGETSSVVLSYARAGHQLEALAAESVEDALERTRKYWEEWSRTLEYSGERADLVLRSALALKLLIFEPTGAIIAAPTTSLPEWIGGTRNWDYRYTWVRDSSLTLIALMELGYFGEARDFLHFFNRTVKPNHAEFKILYGVQGEVENTERDLKHLDGYWRSRPVRIGNGAADQKQLDVYGELMQCVMLYWSHEGFEHKGESFERDFWPLVQHIGDYVCETWREPDNSIWEIRGECRQYVHSKALCRVALDGAIKLAERFKMKADLKAWKRERDSILPAVREHGYNSAMEAFVQSYGADVLDAAMLRLPLLNVFEIDDRQMQSTLAAIESRLMKNGLLYRYTPEADHVGEPEGAFTACGFWLVENLVLAGRIEAAEELFHRLCDCANDVGLLSEQVDPATGQLLGNLPQGFSHVGLVNAAVRLSAAKRGKQTDTQAIVAGK